MDRKASLRSPLGRLSSNLHCIQPAPPSKTNAAKSHRSRFVPPKVTKTTHPSCVRPPSSRRADARPPDTYPAVTDRLWVMVAKAQSTGRGKTPSGRVAPSASNTRPTTRSTHTQSEADSLIESNTSSRPRALRPQQHAAFTTCILAPRNVTINDQQRVAPTPFKHFGTQPEPSAYRESLRRASVFITFGDDAKRKEADIAAQYSFMCAKHLCEAEFATFATETFFLGEKRSTAPVEDRQWRAERMLQLVCPPASNAHWSKPPLLDHSVARSDDFSWDVRPDCAYWVSTRGFNDAYVHNIKGACYVHQGWVLAPYLSVEFKRDDDTIDVARVQAVVAGSMALYNRFQLCLSANEGATADSIAHLSHYTIVFTGSNYTVWKLRPNFVAEAQVDGSLEWNGCSMNLIDQGDCTRSYDVHRLVEWINEIHRWGLATHAPACERDVKQVLEREGVEISSIE